MLIFLTSDAVLNVLSDTGVKARRVDALHSRVAAISCSDLLFLSLPFSVVSFHCWQGAAVFQVPAYFDTSITEPVTVNVQVRTGTEREPMLSDPVAFTYVPRDRKCERNKLAAAAA